MTAVKGLIEKFIAANNLKTPLVTNAITAKEVTENTQASFDALTSIGQYLSTAGYHTNAIDTKIHDQFDSMLCHSYATTSAFRQVIRNLLLDPLTSPTQKFFSKLQRMVSLKKQMDQKDLLESDFSFHRLLTAFVTGVNPRSFGGLNTRQSANTETALFRLVYRTAFEVEGWKKMIPVRDFFISADLKVVSYVYVLSYL